MLADVWEILLRRRWLVVIPLVVVFVVPSVATVALKRSYVSQGTLRVSPNSVIRPLVGSMDQVPNAPVRDPVDVALDDAKLVLASHTFLTEIAVRAGLTDELRIHEQATLSSLQTGTTVSAASPELMMLQFRAKDPMTAHRVAQAELETILAERAGRTTIDAQKALDLLQSEVDSYSQNLRAATSSLDAFQTQHPELALSESQKSILTQLSVLRAELAQVRLSEQDAKGDPTALKQRDAELLQQIDQLSVPVGATPNVQLQLLRLTAEQQSAQNELTNAVTQLDGGKLLARVHAEQVSQDKILDAASLPTSPSRGKALTLATLAFVVAIASAASLVMLAEHLDNKVRRPGDVTASAGLPVLAVLEGGAAR